MQALTKKATPTHVLACEFCEIFKIIFLCTTFPVATSERAWSMERAVTKIISYIVIKYPTSYCEQSHPTSEKKKQTAEERSSFCKILGKWDSNHLAGARTHLIKPKATTKVLKEHVTILLAKMSLKF